MYKCKECGLEYKDKPDYCDCGNDEFEFTELAVKQEEPQLIKSVQPASDIRKKTIPHQNHKKSFSEQYPALSRFISSIDIFSGIIFLSCLILSVAVVLFAWNPKDETQIKTEASESQTNVKNIPSIDKLWNNEIPVVNKSQNNDSTKELIKVEPQKEIKQILPKTETKPAQKNIKQTSSIAKNNTVTKTSVPTAKKSVAQPSKVTQIAAKPAQTATKATSTTKKEISDTSISEKQQLATQNQNINIPQKTEAEKLAEKQAEEKRITLQKKEFSEYKTNLRNAIGRKIDFTKVVGDGSCTVSFKINTSGKLINRSFSKQSSNITLNDAVYAAVMATPSFNPPPSGYKNETLNLNISFYNGNFEITLK